MGSFEAYLPKEFMIPVGISVVIVSICIVTITVKLWPFIRKINFLISDLRGEEARPGVPARPGVMARLRHIEDQNKQTNEHIENSLKDRRRIWKTLEEMKKLIEN